MEETECFWGGGASPVQGCLIEGERRLLLGDLLL